MSNFNVNEKLNEILNSGLMNSIIEEENEALRECGWSRNDVNEMAKYIIKKTK
jgi:hypothetical protein